MPGNFKKIAEAPAKALDGAVTLAGREAKKVLSKQPLKRSEEFWKILGPGLTTGAADDDPSGVATYSQAGARYGFRMLWLAPLTFPLMAIVQEMCARIGLVTGQGLAGNIRDYFPRWVLYTATGLLFAANTFNIGADLGAMAKATQLFVPGASFVLLIIGFTVLSLLLQIFTTYERYARYLKYLALLLLSYVVTGLIIHMPWHELLHYTFIPHLSFSRDEIFLVTGVLGTTISPYLFFWQTSQEVEEEILRGRETLKSRSGATPKEIKNMRTDVWFGMLLSNVVMFFIIAVCAATLFSHGITNIQTAADAASALRPLAGENAYLLFGLGIIATGLLALPVLAGSVSYSISESFRWEHGLYHKLRQAHAFYGVIIISMIVGLILNFVHLDPIKALIYSAVANGVIAPVVLVLIVLLSSNRKVMGHWSNHKAVTVLGWATVGLMSVAGIATIISLFF